MKILDIGCGKNKYAGAVGIDVNPDADADIVHDLNIFPYPLKENEYDRIICHNILEHVSDLVKTIEEIWRVSKNGTVVEIVVPTPSSVWLYADPTHKRAFTSKTLNFFIKDNEYYGRIPAKADFSLLKAEYRNDSNHWWHKLLAGLVNKHMHYYETYFMYIYQTSAIYIEIVANKK